MGRGKDSGRRHGAIIASTKATESTTKLVAWADLLMQMETSTKENDMMTKRMALDSTSTPMEQGT